MLYTVGEMARLLGIAASTLRYYDQEGLLPFVERSQGGIRMFTDSDYGPLLVIGCLKKSGLSIKEIRAFIALAGEGDASLAQRLELFRRRRDAVARQIAELQESIAFIDWKQGFYDDVLAGRRPYVSNLIPGLQPDDPSAGRTPG